MQAESINLVHFMDSGSDQTIDGAGSANHARLVTYARDDMSWRASGRARLELDHHKVCWITTRDSEDQVVGVCVSSDI